MMTAAELILSLVSGATAVCSIVLVRSLMKSSSRDHVVDKERVRRIVDEAPIERLDNILIK